MTEKELRKLKRAELIEILYYMRTEIDELKAENEQLKSRLDQLVSKALQSQTVPSEHEEQLSQ